MFSVFRIIESKNEKYPKGSFCFSQSGWRTHTILTPKNDDREFYLLPDFGNLPLSLGVGAVGQFKDF
jgi:NADPH-dependent curcumin reductase CurA